MVKLGARTDSPSRVADAALAVWQKQFAKLWNDLYCDCTGVLHHEKRIRQIDAKLADPELLIQLPEGSPERLRARDAVEQHRIGLDARNTRIEGLTWGFAEFWKARPDGVDRWLVQEWFPDGDRPDPVVTAMKARDTVWIELEQLCEQAGPPRNREACPY